MFVRRLNQSYDLDRCLVEWDRISPIVDWNVSGDESLQTCLQYDPQSVGNPYTDGAGSFRGTNKVDLDYNILHRIYEGSVLADIIRDLKGVRSRIMTKKMHTTYSVHADQASRYHLALITNPNAYFIFPTLNEILHIPADGYVYEVDTTIPHSFVNCGPDRTHLVISKGAHHDNKI